MKSRLLLLSLVIWIFACGVGSQQDSDVHIPEGLDRRDELRFRQYLITGKQIYLAQCSNCHQPNGQGLEALYPPLAKSDFFVNNLAKSICMIKNGYSGPLTVNGTEYNMVMPALAHLTPLEIAEITTYIGNKWGNKVGFVQVNDVEKILQDCE